MGNFTSKVKNFIEKVDLIKSGDKLVLGVSGGADSVALLVLLDLLKDEYDLSLNVVCVNHGLRVEAAEEASYVETLCRERNIPFILETCDVKALSEQQGKGTEEVGREVRYRAFARLADKLGEGTKIAVAHNKNDLAETMLFHLFRGTGPRGLCSIAPCRDNIIRPLLCVERKEIEAWLNDQGIKYYTDASNLTDDYTRNKIRHHIVEYAADEINAGAVSHMGDTAESLRDLVEWADSRVGDIYELFADIKEGRVIISKDAFKDRNRYINRALVKRTIDELAPSNRDITLKHLDSVLDTIDSTEAKCVNLPYSINVLSEGKRIIFSTKSEGSTEIFSELKGDSGEEALGDYKIKWHVEPKPADFVIEKYEYTKCFDYDKINECPTFRTIREGDYITVNSGLQKKKLADYFIDEKIPYSERKSTLILADESNVWWVVGHRIGEYPKVTNDTKTILYIEVIKEA